MFEFNDDFTGEVTDTMTKQTVAMIVVYQNVVDPGFLVFFTQKSHSNIIFTGSSLFHLKILKNGKTFWSIKKTKQFRDI